MASPIVINLIILNLICLQRSLVVSQEPGGLPLGPDLKFNDQGSSKSKLGPCGACKILVESFDEGLKRTSRGKFEGGDSVWEERNQGKYADSEVRLVEIQESLCNGLPRGEIECHQLAEEHESLIEKWWFGDRKAGKSLYDSLCMEQAKLCCPANHFGPNCKPCPGFPDNVCSGRGTCKGNGTRKGSGKCSCNEGYGGDNCERCGAGHYEAKKDGEESSILPQCLPCDKSCLGHCRGPTPKDCEVCKEGYNWDPQYGCIDRDECLELGYNPCEGNTFCVNGDGSYYCYTCDNACKRCDGDGPDNCLECAENYVRSASGFCVEKEANDRYWHQEITRYATYLGLCIATCIIFRKNIFLASIVGLVVAVYIGVAEYTFNERMFDPVIKMLSS